jgi:hypothetical protein
VHVPILFIGCLAMLIFQLQCAGWSLRRVDRRRTLWSGIGILLSGAAWSRDELSGSPLSLVLGVGAALGVLWAVWLEGTGTKR